MDTNPTAAQPLDLDKVSAGIMNLPCDASPYDHAPDERLAYKIGHRDARHAAAELVNEQAANARAAKPESATGTTGAPTLQPLETVQYWAREFAKDPQRLAGGMIVRLLQEYADLRAQLAAKGQGKPGACEYCAGKGQVKASNVPGGWAKCGECSGRGHHAAPASAQPAYPPRVTPEMVGTLNTTLDQLEKTHGRIAALKAKYGLDASAQPDRGAVQEPVASSAVFLRQSSTFGPWIECKSSHVDAVRFVRADSNAVAPSDAKGDYTHADITKAHTQGYELGLRQKDTSDAKGKADAANAGVLLSDERIDELARNHNLDGSMIVGHRHDYWRAFARAIEQEVKPQATSAADAKDAAKGELRIMPVEPTPEMVRAMKDAWWAGTSAHVMKTTDAYRVYLAAMAAAPSSAAGTEGSNHD